VNIASTDTFLRSGLLRLLVPLLFAVIWSRSLGAARYESLNASGKVPHASPEAYRTSSPWCSPQSSYTLPSPRARCVSLA